MCKISRVLIKTTDPQWGKTFYEVAYAIFVLLKPSYYFKQLHCVAYVYTVVTEGNHHYFDPSLLPKKLWLIFMGKKQKKIFWKKIQNDRLKKTEFFNFPNSQYFLKKFQGWVLWLVGLLMQRALIELNLYVCEAVPNKLKNSLKTQNWELAVLKISIFFQSAILKRFFF